MDQRCDSRPCCRQPLLELREQGPCYWKPLELGKHKKFVLPVKGPCCGQPLELGEQVHQEKFVHPVKGPLKDAWGLGSVWVTCCRAYYGLYFDGEINAYNPMFLGNNEKQAMSRVNFVKSFIPEPIGADWAPGH